jgi:hypothetical protein
MAVAVDTLPARDTVRNGGTIIISNGRHVVIHDVTALGASMQSRAVILSILVPIPVLPVATPGYVYG